MTFRDVYIGALSDRANPLDWGGDWKVGNCPPVESPYFPWEPSMPHHPHSVLIVGVKNGRFQGEDVDWGATAAKMTKGDILAFIHEVYGDELSDKRLMPHLHDKFKKLLAFVNALSNETEYALVANEF